MPVKYVVKLNKEFSISNKTLASILIDFLLITAGFNARKKTFRMNSDFAGTTPFSWETEKSSPRLSKPVRRHATGSIVLFFKQRVLVSFLLNTETIQFSY